MARVFVDTNVLFPFSLMDLMLTLTEDAVHTLVWSDRLLEEWERVIVRAGHRSALAAAGITAEIRRVFADTRVAEVDYKYVLDEVDGPDLDDHHHMAAAIAGRVRYLVTWNRTDFPESTMGSYQITVTDPDSYLCRLREEHPDELAAVLDRMAARKRRPPMSVPDLVEALRRAGVPRFAEQVRSGPR
ncbi:PIN domain-containing protein [Sphaerisporangium rufum]|uniref:PIN domain-containing protein n=1 Tax=Sphaerisporangium rufum TaxID=1381558 RepID=A0A919R9Y7_9ACTN|nr:PIN domain-containing protein [Sphaerisporangium rufum]GII80890.1 PIN domain-containing protein [Sphaerisporangium rufum]